MNVRKAFVSAVATLACTAGLVVAAGEATAAPATTPGATAQQSPGRVQADYYTDPPRTRKQRDDQALAKLGSNLSTATQLGALGGTIIGGVAGCVIGGIIIPAVGCIPGVVTGAGFGAVIGTASAGGPVLIGNLEQYNRTIRSPFVPPKN